MAACHLLSHVEQQRVVAGLVYLDVGGEDMTLAHLTLAAFGRGDVHHLLLTLALALHQFHLLAAGVVVHQAVVVPQQSVALARQNHGQRNLRVHLRQTARQPAHVAVAVLELSQSIEALVLRRVELERGLTTVHLVARGLEHYLSPLVQHAQRLAFLVHAHRGVAVLHLAVLHVEPVWQVALGCRFLHILYSHGVACHVRHHNLSLSKGIGACLHKCSGHQNQYGGK